MPGILRLVLSLLVLAQIAFAQEESAAADHMKAAAEKFRQSDFPGAVEEFTKAIAAEPTLIDAWFGRAQAQLRLEKHGEAIADLDKALELNPKSWQVLNARGGAKMAAHAYEGALADYAEAIKLNPRNYQAHLMRAQMHEAMGELDKAIEDYTAVTHIAAEFWRAYQGRADARAAQGDYKAAMGDLEAAVYLANDPGSKAVVYSSRGRVWLEQRDVEKAGADFEMAVNSAPEQSVAYFSRGRFLHDTGQWKRALADFRKALALQAEGNDYVRFYICLARMRLGENAEGQAELGTFVDMRDKKGDWFAKVALFLAGRTDEKEFLASAKSENEHLTRERECEAYFYAAMARDVAGDKAGATAHAKECVARGVTNFIEYASAKAFLKLNEK